MFSPDILCDNFSEGNVGHIEALANKYGDDIDIVLNLNVLQKNSNHRSALALVETLHELFEHDYWHKSEKLGLSPEQSKNLKNEAEYRLAEHEKIANTAVLKNFQLTLGATGEVDEKDGRLNLFIDTSHND